MMDLVMAGRAFEVVEGSINANVPLSIPVNLMLEIGFSTQGKGMGWDVMGIATAIIAACALFVKEASFTTSLAKVFFSEISNISKWNL
jgi:hypothetical protein